VLTIGASAPRAGDRDSGFTTIARGLSLESPLATAWDGRPVPRAFISWTWLPDGAGLRVRLRPNVRYHDGTILTAPIAADFLRKNLVGNALSSSITSIEPDGDIEILFRTARPEGFLLAELATVEFSLPGKPRVGTGPFRYVADGPPIVLEAFDSYHAGRPAIDRVEIIPYQTQRAAWAAMMRGEINMLHQVSRDAVDFVEAESTIQTHTFLRAYSVGLVFNLRHPVLKSSEVRRALNAAVDRQRIVEIAMRRRAVVLESPVWPSHWAYSSSQPTFGFDPDLARLKLDAAGVTERTNPEPGRMPSRFQFTCLVVAEDQALERIAILLQKQLADVGVDMELLPVRFQELGRRLRDGQFDVALTNLVGSRSLHWLYLLWHSPQTGVPAYLNSGYSFADAALDRLRASISDDEVRGAVADLQRAFFDDPPGVFLAWTETTRALSRGFSVPNEGARDILGTIGHWRPASPEQRARR
jgi:peptide/nickel transport system substrate-binding protein